MPSNNMSRTSSSSHATHSPTMPPPTKDTSARLGCPFPTQLARRPHPNPAVWVGSYLVRERQVIPLKTEHLHRVRYRHRRTRSSSGNGSGRHRHRCLRWVRRAVEEVTNFSRRWRRSVQEVAVVQRHMLETCVGGLVGDG
jgi:hypothetical protein